MNMLYEGLKEKGALMLVPSTAVESTGMGGLLRAAAILHALGADHPARLGGLVYLDAAEDPTLRASDYEDIPVDVTNLPKRVGEPQRVVFPEAETRQLTERPIDPAIRKVTSVPLQHPHTPAGCLSLAGRPSRRPLDQ